MSLECKLRESVQCESEEYAECALRLHKKFKGKLEVTSKQQLKTKEDWSTMYTPGVGAVSQYLYENPKEVRNYTMKNNSVAVISDGSAVLGLGNIGAEASLPVMEGKCAILSEVARIDGIPIVLDTQDTEKIIETIKNIAPTFGAINLEDFNAPRCFEIEDRLKKELNMPIMHDDQHGTAMVVLAGIMNASKVVKKNCKNLKIVIVGAGAAGQAIAKLLIFSGVKNTILVDSRGTLYKGRKNMDAYKKKMASMSNPKRMKGAVEDAVKGADVVIGVSGPGTITKEHIQSMNKDAIVFALANPIPEIMPYDAKEAGATVVATGRSDYPNQVNNSLVFPGVFRGALDNNVKEITDDMKVRVAKKIAGLVSTPTKDKIIPGVTHPRLVKEVASVIT
ncbi:NADP-dependent malic enzyme [Crocinitomicaceae bacterium]|nr:NADP-dependent malic enzyme [Crocinitomicaceae bacterium]